MLTGPHTIPDIVRIFKSSQKDGLTDTQVIENRSQYSANVSYLYKKKSVISVFISQFSTPLILVLVLISFMSLIIGQRIDGLVILAMLLVNAVVGTFQEMKAEKSLQKLSALITHSCRVRRNKEVVTIPHEEVVCGDIVLLKTGEIIPADIRIFDAHSMSCNESVLTGESLPRYKEVVTIEEGSQPHHMRGTLFMGASVVSGYGEGIVIATGKNTFLGQSVNTRTREQSPTAFERNMRQFSDNLFKFVLLFSGITATVNMYLGRDLVTSLMLGVMLALGITPEILPIIVTVAMSQGAFQLAKKKVVVRRLTALEDLGNVDVLCTDKTGTLTTGKIKVVASFDAQGNHDDDVVSLAYLCSAVFPPAYEKTTENPLDTALLSAISEDKRKELNTYQLLDIADFDFVTKRMLSLVIVDGKRVLIKKGASELLLQHCTSYFVDGKMQRLSQKEKDDILTRISRYEDEGYRVISIAREYVSDVVNHVGDSKKMEYVGFMTLADPPRMGIDSEFEELHALSIRTKIITGDSAAVTMQVAREVGLKVSENDIVSGEDLEQLSDEAFSELLLKKTFFVRTTPLQKLRIIQGYRELGHTVAYMGDGINDVGALREADVGISVDSATPVTKDVSDVILLSKTLHALGDAVQLGRKTFANTLKFILNTMSSSFGNVITAAIASFFLPFIPLLPKQLLLLDSLSDLQHLVFATDSVDSEQLKTPKRWSNRFIVSFIMVFGLLSTAFDFIHISIFSFITKNPDLFRTLWFIESIATEMLATFSIRTQRFLFKSRPSTMLMTVSIGVWCFALILPLLPYVSGWMGFVGLSPIHYLLILGIVISYVISLEIVKLYFYRKQRKEALASI